jgi:hypothetical protein
MASVTIIDGMGPLIHVGTMHLPNVSFVKAHTSPGAQGKDEGVDRCSHDDVDCLCHVKASQWRCKAGQVMEIFSYEDPGLF